VSVALLATGVANLQHTAILENGGKRRFQAAGNGYAVESAVGKPQPDFGARVAFRLAI
jgi:hypothetical protein